MKLVCQCAWVCVYACVDVGVYARACVCVRVCVCLTVLVCVSRNENWENNNLLLSSARQIVKWKRRIYSTILIDLYALIQCRKASTWADTLYRSVWITDFLCSNRLFHSLRHTGILSSRFPVINLDRSIRIDYRHQQYSTHFTSFLSHYSYY